VKISAVIIAFNEAHNIENAIESVAWADEIIVVDSESTDNTREISKAAGATVIARAWQGFSKQKQFAMDQAANDLIFSLDADERVSPKLRDEILALKTTDGLADGYRIPRLSIYMGKAIRHGGWYPDWQLRLFDRRKGKWLDVLVHESFQMQDGAKISRLTGEITHLGIEDAGAHHGMIGERYAPLAARQMFIDGRSTSPLKIVFAGPAAFVRGYLVKAGFLDGLPGFVIAKFAAHNAFLKHLLLWQLNKSDKTKD
jgi:glycosyltransferase involved in cell wall biosynthesis